MIDGYKRKWETGRGGRSVSDASRDSYYGLPVIHAPHWGWLIIAYFFLGGISSASYVIASIAELFGGAEGHTIKRVGRYLSLAALIPCPILLILDLGRPERFHHMLRVVKLRSPMSLGVWGLTIFGMLSAVTVLIQAADDGLLSWCGMAKRLLLALPCRTINVLGGIFGFFVGGYTGVLLGITVVPLWAKNALLLGPMFLSSALSTGSAAIALVLSRLPGRSEPAIERVERLEALARLAELGLLLTARANAGPAISQPLNAGRLGQLFRWGVLGGGIGAPLALQVVRRLLRGRPARASSVLGSLLTLIGGLCLRYVMVMAGRASAADPAATFEFARGDERQA